MSFFDRFRRNKHRTQDGFQAMALDVLGTMDAVASAAPHETETFALAVRLCDSDDVGTFFLDNIFDDTDGASAEETRARLYEHFDMACGRRPIPSSWVEASDVVYGSLQTPDMVAWLLANDVVFRPALDDLVQIAFVDLGTAQAFVTQTQLADWGASTDDLWESAGRNLVRMAPNVPPVEKPSIVLVNSAEVDIASALLAPGWLSAFANGHEVFVSIGANDPATFFFTDTRDEDFSSFIKLADEAWEEADDPLTPRLMTLEGDEVAPLTVDVDHPCFAPLEATRTNFQGAMAARQGEQLRAAHEEQGLDIYVANVILIQHEGVQRSLVVWPDGVDTMLPAADFVALSREEGETSTQVVPMRALVRELELEPVEGCFPLRYRLCAFPTGEKWQRLEAHVFELGGSDDD